MVNTFKNASPADQSYMVYEAVYNIASGWDIAQFRQEQFSSDPYGSVTYEGRVYHQRHVNYYLAGCIYLALYDTGRYEEARTFYNHLAAYTGMKGLFGYEEFKQRFAFFDAAVEDELPPPPSDLSGLLPGPAFRGKIPWDWKPKAGGS